MQLETAMPPAAPRMPRLEIGFMIARFVGRLTAIENSLVREPCLLVVQGRDSSRNASGRNGRCGPPAWPISIANVRRVSRQTPPFRSCLSRLAGFVGSCGVCFSATARATFGRVRPLSAVRLPALTVNGVLGNCSYSRRWRSGAAASEECRLPVQIFRYCS
jgi:hypothetical protein